MTNQTTFSPTSADIPGCPAVPPVPHDPVDVRLRREDVLAAARSRNGLTFKGFGVLSGNATSSLLLDYKAEQPDQYWRLLRVLFGGPDPMMTIVKIEMGNDRNTSTGPEPAVMRHEDDYPDVAREPGFQLAADARRFNPRLHTSILRWCYPVWVRSDFDHERIYRWYKNTILAVYRRYGYMIDSVNPHINECPADLGWAREFARRVRTEEQGFEGAGRIRDLDGNPVPAWADEQEKRLFRQIRVIVSDEESTGTFGPRLVHDPDTRNAVDIAAYHYSSADDTDGNFTALADRFDKQVWNSEAQATFSLSADRPNTTMNPTSGEGEGSIDPRDGSPLSAGTGMGGINGPLEMANTVIRGFASSRRTAFIYQPAISAFYDGGQYSSKELVALHFPWDGYINWDGALAVLRHFSAFCHAGFEDCSLPGDSADAAADRAGRETAGTGAGQPGADQPGVDQSGADHQDSSRPGAGRVWRAIPQATVCEIGDGRPPGLGDGPDSARAGAASCLTLAAPDGSDFSTVIVNDSRFARTYRLDVDPALGRGSEGISALDVWRTRGLTAQEQQKGSVTAGGSANAAGHTGPADLVQTQAVRADAHYLQRLGTLHRGTDGRFTVRVEPWSITTVTSLPAATVEKNRDLPLLVEPVGAIRVLDHPGTRHGDGHLLYADDFEYATMPAVETYAHGRMVREDYLASRGGNTGAVPRYTMDTNGAFEVVRSSDALSGTHVLRQQVGPGMDGHAWNPGDPRTLIGDMRWADYDASISARLRTPGTVSLGARQWGGTPGGERTAWAQLTLSADGEWTFRRYGTVMASGTAGQEQHFTPGLGVWNRLRVRVAGSTATAFLNDVRIASFTDPRPQLLGRIQLGTSFAVADFDDLRVEKIEGTVPSCTDVIDDMHLYRWDNGAPVLRYTGPWQHLDGQSMFCYKRSLSTAAAIGAGISLHINGTGVVLLGQGDGTARLHVDVDGRRVGVAQRTWAADTIQPSMFAVSGLPAGEHEIRLTKADNRPLTLDAVAVLGARWYESA